MRVAGECPCRASRATTGSRAAPSTRWATSATAPVKRTRCAETYMVITRTCVYAAGSCFTEHTSRAVNARGICSNSVHARGAHRATSQTCPNHAVSPLQTASATARTLLAPCSCRTDRAIAMCDATVGPSRASGASESSLPAPIASRTRNATAVMPRSSHASAQQRRSRTPCRPHSTPRTDAT